MSQSEQVNFGYKKVSPEEKTELVGDVFKRVAQRYDVMNDLMSLGTHRLFKRMVIQMSGIRPGHKVLDLAGGTGDMSALYADVVGSEGTVVLTDWLRCSSVVHQPKHCLLPMTVSTARASALVCATSPIKTVLCVNC